MGNVKFCWPNRIQDYIKSLVGGGGGGLGAATVELIVVKAASDLPFWSTDGRGTVPPELSFLDPHL